MFQIKYAQKNVLAVNEKNEIVFLKNILEAKPVPALKMFTLGSLRLLQHVTVSQY